MISALILGISSTILPGQAARLSRLPGLAWCQRGRRSFLRWLTSVWLFAFLDFCVFFTLLMQPEADRSSLIISIASVIDCYWLLTSQNSGPGCQAENRR